MYWNLFKMETTIKKVNQYDDPKEELYNFLSSKWHSNFNINNDKLDQEHKVIIAQIKQMIIDYSHGSEYFLYSSTKDELFRFIDNHLAIEESILKNNNSKILHEHKYEFQIFRNIKSIQFKSDFDIIIFILKWFNDHLMNQIKNKDQYKPKPTNRV